MSAQFRDIFCRSADGLKLHAKVTGPDNSTALPVLCLPGLTRTADDFDDIARAIASDPARPRKVVAVDYRGRGLSDHDPDHAAARLVRDDKREFAMGEAIAAL